MHLGELGPVLADFYQQGLTIELAIERDRAMIAETPAFEPVTLEPELAADEDLEEAPEGVAEAQPESVYPSVAEVLSLTGEEEPEE
jgi:hypothetical protein